MIYKKSVNMVKLNINLENLKNQFIDNIILSIKDKAPQTANEQLNQFFSKYLNYFKDFSIRNHESVLPELLGYAMLYGFSLGQFSSDLKHAINKLIEKWLKEFDKKKFEDMYR